MLNKLQKQVSKVVGPALAVSLETLAKSNQSKVFSVGITLQCYSKLAKLVPLADGRSTSYSNRLHDFSVTIHVKRMYILKVSSHKKALEFSNTLKTCN